MTGKDEAAGNVARSDSECQMLLEMRKLEPNLQIASLAAVKGMVGQFVPADKTARPKAEKTTHIGNPEMADDRDWWECPDLSKLSKYAVPMVKKIYVARDDTAELRRLRDRFRGTNSQTRFARKCIEKLLEIYENRARS